MIDLYFWPTPNGWKIAIMLEECGLPYNVVKTDIGRGDQFKPEFIAISPNNKIPAILDDDGPGGAPLSLFESGAILLYLAEKTGQFLSTEFKQRQLTIEWLMWQMGGLGPMLGQHGHFKLYATENIPYAIERYRDEAERLYGVMDRQLEVREFLCDEYSIADMACWPWILTYKSQGLDLDAFPNVRRWYDALKTRPGLRRGYDLGKDLRKAVFSADGPNDETRRTLFRQKVD